jgi:hypothetical protein
VTGETKQARWAGQRQALGLCPRCGGTTDGPNIYCNAHRALEHLRNVRRRSFFRERKRAFSRAANTV